MPDPDCGEPRMKVTFGLFAAKIIFFSKKNASLDDNFHGIPALNSQLRYSKDL
jgi:hypothetical protein